jgi:AcrR family transcriptional regulator
MEAGAQTRELTGEKATKIVEAMRASVAKRGIAGSTFEHVAREAGVSRGLLHYYFGTKERLLVEVVRRDADVRITRLDEPLGKAKTVDDVLDVLVTSLELPLRDRRRHRAPDAHGPRARSQADGRGGHGRGAAPLHGLARRISHVSGPV